jgi:hypothetical protein
MKGMAPLELIEATKNNLQVLNGQGGSVQNKH